MNEDQLRDLWNKVYDFVDIAMDSSWMTPDDVADKAVEYVKEILGEE